MPAVPIDLAKMRTLLLENQQIPSEGPKALVFLLDMTTNASQSLSLLLTEQTGYISMLQTIFIDMTGIATNLIITLKGSGQKIFAKAATQGYYNVLCPNPVELQFDGTIGAGQLIPIFLINAPIPGVVWASQ